MKKYWLLFGAVILVMGLASPSMAQFKSWGHLEIQTIWLAKPDFNTGAPWQQDNFNGGLQAGANAASTTSRATSRDLTWRHVAERFRFYLQYGDPKTVRAVIGFEADSTDWGQQPNTSSTVSGGGIGVYRADQVQLEVKHAYLDFVIPGTPLTLTAGIQNWDIFGRLWMNNDAPGIRLTANLAPHKIQLWWWRENDSSSSGTAVSRATYGVNDVYGITWDMTQQLFNLGALFAYKNDLWTGNSGDVPANYPGDLLPFQIIGAGAQPNKYDEKLWWAGVNGGFRPGNWNFTGEFIYSGGTREFKTPGVSDSDIEGWAVEARAAYQVGPGMFVGVEGFYSTGNDADKSDKIKLYRVPTNTEGESIFGNDRTVFFWMNAAQIGYYHERQLAYAGMWYGRANFEYSPIAWLRFNLNYLYIGDTSKGSPGTGTSPFTKVATATKIVNSPLGAQQFKNEDYIGSEINLITNITIYPGFVYNIGLAVFFPGSVYDLYNSSGSKIKDPDTAYGVNTKLIYAF